MNKLRASKKTLALRLRISSHHRHGRGRPNAGGQEGLTGRVPDVPLLKSVRASVHPRRTGDIVVIQKPHWYLYEDAAKFSAMHGSPYAYDFRVPLGFAGPGIPSWRVSRAVDGRGVAPTISALLGIAPPPGSSGMALEEVLGGRDRR